MASEPVPGGDKGVSTVPAESAGLLYERYRDRVFGYCLYMLGNKDEADDATQTTFLHAFRALRRGVVPAAETAWLLKIAENVCLSWRRSAARRRRVEDPSTVIDLQEVLPARDRPADELIGLEGALAEMPPAQRSAILLREWQGLSYREIGDRLKLSQAAVETLLFRARRTLAKNLTVPPTARRRVARALDFGGLVGAIKSAFAGASAVKVAATVATVAAVATATAIVEESALGDFAVVEKESQKEVDVVAAPAGATFGSPSFQSTERIAVSRGRAAPGERPRTTTTAKKPKAGETKDGPASSEPTGSSAAGSDAGGPGSAPAGGSRALPLSPPSLGRPRAPPALKAPLELPLNPPTVNPPALNPAGAAPRAAAAQPAVASAQPADASVATGPSARPASLAG